jgi:acyl-CoA synthetase (AMP-forming)/AMP-acid ligase II
MIFTLDAEPRRSRIALLDGADGAEIVYEELAARVQACAAKLGERSLIFLFCRNTVSSVVWYLAALEGGHAVALLPAGLAAEFQERLMDLYKPEWILSPDRADYAAMGYQAAGEEGLWRRFSDLAGPLHPDLSLLLSTSGTTGNPKFVRLTRANIEANTESISAALGIQPDDRAIASLSMHYSYGLSVLNTHLREGASIALTDEGLMSSGFWNVFRSRNCTSFAGVPYSYQILKRLRPQTLRVDSLRTMTQAGGKLHADLAREFHGWITERNGRFFVMYGQTEATARICILPSNALPQRPGSAGIAIPGGRLSVQGPEGLTAEPGIEGELVYEGPNVMMGYAGRREDLTRGDELGGVLFTGDTAQLDSEGFVYISGRAKRDAKLYGLRVNLDDVEQLLRSHGPAAVIASEGKLVIFCEQGDASDYTRYRQELAAKLQVHHQAFEFRRIERLPLNASGKIDYQDLTGRL